MMKINVALRLIIIAVIIVFQPVIILFSQDDPTPKVTTSQELKTHEQELQRLQKDISDKKKQTIRLHKKEKGILRSLATLEKSTGKLKRQIKQIKKEEKIANQNISGLQTKVGEKEEQLQLYNHQFGLRLRELYKKRRVHELEWLLIAESYTQFFKNLKHLNRVARETRTKYNHLQNQKLKLEENKQLYEEELDRKSKIRDKKNRLQKKYANDKKSRSRYLKNIQSKRSLFEAALKEKEDQYKEIQRIIDQLEHKRTATTKQSEKRIRTQFAKGKGSMLWPAKGKIIGRFGKNRHPRFKTITFNKGIDISVRTGDPVHAVWNGKVILADWIRGYGKFMILDHGDGYYTLYAHLSEVLAPVGKTVSQGTVIGEAGESGSLHGPVMHFELRKGKNVLNPLQWLR